MRMKILAAMIALAALPAGLSSARADPAPEHGELIYRQRCQSCHEPAVGRAPGREALAARSPGDIERALTTGVMMSMAAGLSPEDIRAVAGYLATGRATVETQAERMCTSHPPIRPGASDWASLGVDERSSRFQPHPGLSVADLPRLKVRWSFALQGGGQPTVVGDWLFTSDRGGKLYALDARTGCVHWTADGVRSRTTPMIVRSKRSPSGWATFVGVDGRILKAFDAQTGQILWASLPLEAHPTSWMTGTPVVVGDHIFVPMSSIEEVAAAKPTYPCCTFRGSLTALDITDGKRLWQTYAVDEPLMPIRKNAAGAQMQGPAGGAIWSAPTIDLKRGLIYAATGDSYTEAPTRGADALIAIDMRTGQVRWKHQVTAADNYTVGCAFDRQAANCPNPSGPDYDFGASPILMDVPGGGQVLVAGQKSGMVYGFNPATGAQLWMTRVGAGSALGGVEWGLTSDGRRVFAANADTVILLDEAARAMGKGFLPIGSPPAKPGLTALDPATGRIVWQTPAPVAPCHYHVALRELAPGTCIRAQSAAPSAMPGVVFSGTLDGWLRAYEAATGKVLWAFSTTATTYDTVNGIKDQPGGGIDGMGPTIANGMVYTMSGFNGAAKIGGNPINVLLAFSVDGK